MGAFLKYLIPVCLIALGAIIFQNCGKSLQANGDPYENNGRVQVEPILDPPTDSNGAPTSPPNFNPELVCSGSATNLIFAVNLGKKNNQDSVMIQLKDGRYKIYPWPPATPLLVLNDAMTANLTVQTVQLSNNKITIKLSNNDSLVTEILNCQ